MSGGERSGPQYMSLDEAIRHLEDHIRAQACHCLPYCLDYLKEYKKLVEREEAGKP